MTIRCRSDERGLSLVEVALALFVLTAMMVPSIGDFVSNARRVKARSDVQVIASGLARFLFDMRTHDGQSGAWSACDILVGAGAVPDVRADSDAQPWAAPLDARRACAIDDYLVTNAAGYAAAANTSALWRQGWAGPDFGSGVGPDPWGRRYAVSVRRGADGSELDTVVLSAGPDGIVDTPFAAAEIAPRGDDILVVMAADGREPSRGKLKQPGGHAAGAPEVQS
jgi:hypothetical protein